MMLEQNGDPTAKTKQFTFPQSRLDFETVVNVSDVKSRLKIHESLYDKFKISDIYNIAQVKSQKKYRIIALCKYCKKQPSRLVWSKKAISQQSYRLKKFESLHEHTILKKQIHKQILALLSNSYAKLPINEIEEYCIKKFEITSDEFKLIKKYMVKKMYEKTFVDDLQDFKRNNYLAIFPQKIKIDTQTRAVLQFPHYLYASSKKMINNLQHYGRVIFLHRFPFLIKKTPNNLNDYFVLVVSGVNQYANIIFFAFAIMSEMTAQFVSETLINLFRTINHSVCETIFSENQPFFNEGVQLFKKQTENKSEHLWDLLLEIKQPNEVKKQLFKQALMAATYNDFKNTITSYQNLIIDESLKFQVFRKKAPKYCLSQIPPVFVGLSPPITHCADILNAILKNFPKEMEYNRFVFKFFEFLNSNKIKRYPQQLVQSTEMPLLGDCIGLVPSQPFNYVLNNLINSIDINVTSKLQRNQLKLGDFQISVTERVKKGTQVSNDPSFKSKLFQRASLSYNQIQLKCTCKIKQKTGIPCSHIIRACLHLQIPISSQLDQFWSEQPPIDIERQIAELLEGGNDVGNNKLSQNVTLNEKKRVDDISNKKVV